MNKFKGIKIEQSELMKAYFKLHQIDQWFLKNDWKVNKIVIGEWAQNDSRWIQYLNEREEKRKERDELLSKIEELKTKNNNEN